VIGELFSNVGVFPSGIRHDLFGYRFVESAFDVDVFAVRICEVAAE
jgi:hypothetical protein